MISYRSGCGNINRGGKSHPRYREVNASDGAHHPPLPFLNHSSVDTKYDPTLPQIVYRYVQRTESTKVPQDSRHVSELLLKPQPSSTNIKSVLVLEPGTYYHTWGMLVSCTYVDNLLILLILLI